MCVCMCVYVCVCVVCACTVTYFPCLCFLCVYSYLYVCMCIDGIFQVSTSINVVVYVYCLQRYKVEGEEMLEDSLLVFLRRYFDAKDASIQELFNKLGLDDKWYV